MPRTSAHTLKKRSLPVPVVPQALTHRFGNAEDREHRIAVAAYYRAEQRGFQSGDPVADWLEAEAEVDAWINNEIH